MDSVPNAPQEEAKGTQEPDPKPTAPPSAPSFSQEDVNRLIGKARQDERAKYPDYDDLKKELEESKRAQLSKEERLQADLAKAERERADADGKIADTLIMADVKVMAAQMGLVDPEVVAQIIDRSGISYTEEGGVKGVSEALEALVAEKAYLKGGGLGQAPNLNPGGKPPEAVTGLTQDQRDAARVMFPGIPPAEAEAEYRQGL
tara:strand:- start:696 stop:1307 length:612 start_codon:yes stop_codon:yes gene_type:complete